MPKTYYYSNALLDHVLRYPVGPALPRPTAVFLGLFTDPPTQAGGGTEVTGNNYARLPITFTAPGNGASTNASDLFFPVATGLWGLPTHFGIFDALSGGHLLYFDVLSAPSPVPATKQIVIRANQLVVLEI